jgi:hypothetical protein
VFVAIWLTTKIDTTITLSRVPTTWDGSWYLAVTERWYPSRLPMVNGRIGGNTAGFFPAYPGLARVLSSLTGIAPIGVLVTISLVTGWGATLLVWRIGEVVWDRETADRAASLFAFFPSSFVFSIAYSEGLMLVLAAGALLCMLRRRWVFAGILGAFATATRANAIALVLAAAVAAGVAIWEDREWRALVAPLLTPLGYVGFVVYLHERTGLWDAYTRTQEQAWNQEIRPDATWQVLKRFNEHWFADVNLTFLVVGLPIAIAAIVLLVRARPPLELLAYAIGILALTQVSQDLGVRPRFLLTAFPLAYGVARHPSLHRHLAPLLGGLLGLFTFITITTLLHTP